MVILPPSPSFSPNATLKSPSSPSVQQRRNLDARKPPSQQEAAYIKNLDGTSPVHRIFGAAFQCSHVVARAHEAVTTATDTSPPTDQLEKFIAEIKTFDSTLIRLFASCVSPSSSIERDCTDAEIQVRWMSTQPTYRAMAMWVFLKASRIILHQTCLECLAKFHQSSPEPDISNSQATITASADAILSSVTYMTERLDPALSSHPCRGPQNSGGYYLLWPLHVIGQCEYLDQALRSAACDALMRIGSVMGLRHALEIAKVGD